MVVSLGWSAELLSFFCAFVRNHRLLQIFGRPQWLTVKCRSHSYVNKIIEEVENMGCQIKPSCAIDSVISTDGGDSLARLVTKYKGHRRSRFVVRSCFGGYEQAFIASGSEDS